MSTLSIVLVLVLLLLVVPVVVLLYVTRVVRRPDADRPGVLEVEVHPALPTSGIALRFVLRVPRGLDRVRVLSIAVDATLAETMALRPPPGFAPVPADASLEGSVEWEGALDVDRRGVELTVPGTVEPHARGRVVLRVAPRPTETAATEDVVVDWPDDLHGRT